MNLRSFSTKLGKRKGEEEGKEKRGDKSKSTSRQSK